MQGGSSPTTSDESLKGGRGTGCSLPALLITLLMLGARSARAGGGGGSGGSMAGGVGGGVGDAGGARLWQQGSSG
jgi:hypothetical protein